MFRRAETVAVFQFESPGMRRMLLEAKPDRFGDIVALDALYRPGPMDLIPDFIARKKGERFEYPDPRVKAILEETYGIMVYQEQVMQMAQIVGGYSLGGADLLRRAMGKKKADEMATHRVIFAEGAAKNGVTRSKANEIFDLMEKFAGYGFNKAHAAAYSLLAVQTAWLKAHFAAEFMAANLSAAQDDTDKVKSLIEDSRHHGLEIRPPDLNASDARFTPIVTPVRDDPQRRASAIRYGLCAVKGTGGAAIDAIVAAREAGPYRDLFDLCARVDKRLVNRRVVEALVRAGALDSLTPDGRDGRASLFATIGRAMDAAEHAELHANQVSLFGALDDDAHKPEPVRVPAWTEKQTLGEEKLALGFYLSGHLFREYEVEVRRFARTPLASVQPSREPQTVAGIVAACPRDDDAAGQDADRHARRRQRPARGDGLQRARRRASHATARGRAGRAVGRRPQRRVLGRDADERRRGVRPRPRAGALRARAAAVDERRLRRRAAATAARAASRGARRTDRIRRRLPHRHLVPHVARAARGGLRDRSRRGMARRRRTRRSSAACANGSRPRTSRSSMASARDVRIHG